MRCFTGLTNWWYTITNMVRTIIQRYSSSNPMENPIKPVGSRHLAAPLPSLTKQFQLLLRAECWMLELRRWGRLRHERSSSETWYYQLLPQNIRDTAISRANNHTICCEGSWTLNILTHSLTDWLAVVPVQCYRSRDSPPTVAQKPDLSIRHQISGTAAAQHRAGTELSHLQTTWNISTN